MMNENNPLGESEGEQSPDDLTGLILEFESALYSGGIPQIHSEKLAALTSEQSSRFESACRQMKLLYSLGRAKTEFRTPLETTRIPDSDDGEDSQKFDIDPSVILGAAGSQFGRFEVLRGLGLGGHGIVFLARDPVLDRLVALKVPRPDVLISSSMRRRFLAEGRAAAMLMHPNIVTVFESGESGAICYLVQDYVPGSSLDVWLREHPGPASPRMAADFLAQLAEGVGFAHSQQILHRDIKPSNILLAPKQNLSANPGLSEFVPKLADFGTAKLMHNAVTQTAGVIGTPAYMSPEQLSGAQNGVGPESDVFSLGAVLYELLTGQPARCQRGAEDSGLWTLHTELVPPRRVVKTIPRELEAICLKSLHVNPRQRYTSGKELAKDLRAFVEGRPTVAHPESAGKFLWRWCLRYPITGAAVALALISIVALLVSSLSYNARLRESLEVVQRQQKDAERRELALRRRVYVDDLNLAEKAWKNSDVRQVRRLLETYLPKKGDTTDLRNFPWWLLWRESQESSVFLGRHTGSVGAVAVNDQGSLAASASNDGIIRLWKIPSGESAAELTGHDPKDINCLEFSHNDAGKRLISAGDDGTVRIWNVSAHRVERILKVPAGWVATARFLNAKEELIATAGSDRMIRIWETTSGRLIREWEAHRDTIRDLCRGPEEKTLASCSEDGTVRLWNWETGTPDPRLSQGTFKSPAAPGARWARTIVSSRDSRYLWGGYGDGRLVRWRICEPDFGEPEVVNNPESGIRQLSCPDEKSLLLAAGNRILFGGDTTEGRVDWELLKGHEDWVMAISSVPRLGGVISGDRGGAVRWWPRNQLTGDLVADTRKVGLGAGLTIDRSRAAMHVVDGNSSQFLIYRNDNPAPDVIFNIEQCLPVFEFYLSRDTRILMTTVEPEKEVYDFKAFELPSGKLLWSIRTLNHWLDAGQPSPNAEELAVRWNREVWIIDIRNGQKKHALVHPRAAKDLIFNLDGSQLLTSCEDGKIRIWDSNSGVLLKEITAHPETVTKLSLSPDGKRLASFGEDGQAKVWNTADWTEIARFSSDDWSSEICLLDEGETLAIVATNKLAFWSIREQRLLYEMDKPWGKYSLCIFSSDRKRIGVQNLTRIKFLNGLP